MKNRIILFLVVLSGLTIYSGVLNSNTAVAAPAECYNRFNVGGGPGGGESPVTRARCNATFRNARCTAATPPIDPCTPLPPNKCYKLESGRLEIRPIDGPICQGWRFFGGEVPEPTGGGGGGGGGGGTAGDFEIDNPDREENLNCSGTDCLENNSLVGLLKAAIRFFTVIIGVVIVCIIIWAGFTYAHAGGDPSKTSEAKNRIKNAIIALAVFIFLEALLNWAIPGNLF